LRRTETNSKRIGLPVSDKGAIVVREDTIIKGEIRNCRQIEIYGYVEGDVAAQNLLVHKEGQCYGTVKIETADVLGTLQGNVSVKHLINIRSSGSVTGNVRYGQLAMEAGANLSAQVRNVPPTLAGDLDLAVDKGRSVRITPEDLTAFDPDDSATELVFTIANVVTGHVAYAGAPRTPTTRFTQADLESGKMLFVHDGSETERASFEVSVTDHAGATSGAQTVNVAIRARR
jgi:cytoskeletal protein CcmA (bactofilin family)